MNTQEIEDKVKTIIVDKFGILASKVTLDADFTKDLGADSLDKVELIMEFEREFQTTIPDDKAEKIVTVGDVVSYLSKVSSLKANS